MAAVANSEEEEAAVVAGPEAEEAVEGKEEHKQMEILLKDTKKVVDRVLVRAGREWR